MKPKTIVLLVIIALFVFVLLQNMDNVTIQLLFWPIHTPLLVLILVSVFIGAIIGWFTHMASSRGKYKNKLLKEKERLSASKQSSESRTAEPEK